MNKAGAFVSPYAAVFPFTQDELPNSISSPDWNKLDLNMTGDTALNSSVDYDRPRGPRQLSRGLVAVGVANSSSSSQWVESTDPWMSRMFVIVIVIDGSSLWVMTTKTWA